MNERGKYKRTPNIKEKMSLSHKGKNTWTKGKKLSEETKKKMSEAHKKNPTNFWLGKKRPDVSIRVKGIKRPEITGVKNTSWKGVDVSYSGIHHWIKRELGKPLKCCNLDCSYPRKNASRSWVKTPKRFEWANVSKKYKREKSDFISLCPSCHQKWDKGLIQIKYARNKKL